MIDANDYGSAPSGTDYLDASSAPSTETDRVEMSGPTTSTTPDATTHAKEQAAAVGQTAAAAGQKVAGTAKNEATKVAAEAKSQVKDLYGQTKSELAGQAGAQQERVASGLYALSDELADMASKSETHGVASDLVQQAAQRAGSIASWLGDRDPGTLLDEVRHFARQRPGTFIAIAAAAGVVAGRLTRSIVSESADAADSAEPAVTPGTTGTTQTASVRPVAPVTTLPTTIDDPGLADDGLAYPPVPARSVLTDETPSGVNR